MQKFKTVDELVSQLKPEKPVYCIRKNSIHVASKTFQNKFPGEILYAVKTNPHTEVLKTILESGINNFDVASIKEIETIRKISPKAKCSYMHTVKSQESIKEAYSKFGIKTFSLDILWAIYAISDESIPPDKNTPKGTSEIILMPTESLIYNSNFSFAAS